MCYGYIYLIEDTTNGKKYVGQHKYKNFMLDDKYHGSGLIIVNINRKRPETLKMEYIMGVDTLEEANFFEEYWIKWYNTLSPNGYNLTTGGSVYSASESTREKHREISKKLWQNEEYRNSHTGENNHRHGIKYDEKTKEKMREITFSLWQNEDYRKRQVESHTGHKWTEEQRRKNYEKHKNGKCSKKIIQYTLDGEFVAEYPSLAQVNRDFGYAQTNLSKCCLGKRKSAYGYVWRYK